jgi:hypothetical protein
VLHFTIELGVLEIVRDKKVLKKTGLAGRKRVLEKYSFEKHFDLQKRFIGAAPGMKLKKGLK